MTLVRPASLLVAIAVGGCTYITPKTFEDKVNCLDEDGDGAVASASCETLGEGEAADCDDSRDYRFPGNPEVPYDGIDQDCNSADLVDADGDLYPGIPESSWSAAHPGIDWPTNLQCDDLCDDPLTELDCNDNASTTFPLSAAEVPYDGVDANCQGDDDWDFDKDGHVPPDSLHGGVPYTGSLPQDDCDDTRIDVYPGPQLNFPPPVPQRQADIWYDGVDDDCNGVNDFDQDGDGYIPDVHLAAYATFLQHYEYPDDRPCTASDGSCNDCDDEPDDDGGQPKPAIQVNPAATETYYDGQDQNCDGLDDYDKDLDGFPCDGTTDVGCSLPVPHVGTDCADSVPGINPSALELAGDSTDQDCNGDEDAPHFNFGGLFWMDPTTPDIARSDEHFIIGASAVHFGSDTSKHSTKGIAIHETAADGTGDYDQILDFEPYGTADLPLGHAIAMTSADGVFSLAVSAYETDPEEKTRLRVRQFDWLAASHLFIELIPTTMTNAPINGTGPDPDPYKDFDVALEGDKVWGAGCSPSTVHFTIAVTTPPRGAFRSSIPTVPPSTPIAGGGDVCWLEVTSATTGVLHTYLGSTYREFDLDGPAGEGAQSISEVSSPDHPTEALSPLDARHRGQYVVFARGAAGISVYDIVAGTTPTTLTPPDEAYSADIAKVGNMFFLAAVIDDTDADGKNNVIVSRADSLAELDDAANIVNIPFEDANDSDPDGVAIYADSESLVLVAVSGLSSGDEDALGWTFLGFAP